MNTENEQRIAIRKMYREAWRQARLWNGFVLGESCSSADAMKITESALKLHGVPSWIGSVTRVQLIQRQVYG